MIKATPYDEAIRLHCGWLDREGNFYKCGFGDHEIVARDLGVPGSIELEKDGWVKISDHFAHWPVLNLNPVQAKNLGYKFLKPSSQQVGFVLMYLTLHQKHNQSIIDWWMTQ